MACKQQCYLAGPMSPDEEWRQVAQTHLEDFGVKVVKPEFLQTYCEKFGVLPEDAAQILTERDRRFASGSDYVLANFEGATSRSMGTCIELGWADSPKTTTVAVIPEGNPHIHPIVENVCDYVVHTLTDALRIIEALSWRNK